LEVACRMFWETDWKVVAFMRRSRRAGRFAQNRLKRNSHRNTRGPHYCCVGGVDNMGFCLCKTHEDHRLPSIKPIITLQFRLHRCRLCDVPFRRQRWIISVHMRIDQLNVRGDVPWEVEEESYIECLLSTLLGEGQKKKT